MANGKGGRKRGRKFRRQTKPGAVPGTMVTAEDAAPSIMHLFHYAPGTTQEIPQATLEIVQQHRGHEGTLWLDVSGLRDVELIAKLGGMFGLHPLALEDVLHVHQRSKLEAYTGHLYVVARMPTNHPTFESEQISLFVGSNWIVTFQEREGDCFGPIRERIRHKLGRINEARADYLAYTLLDSIIDAYFPLIEQYASRLDDLEIEIAEMPGSQPMQRLYAIRRDLLEVRRVLWPHRETVNSLIRDTHDYFQPETIVYLRDCYDHVVQLMDVAETCRETCTDLRELHLSEVGQRTNNVMKVLTIIATIFMPMSFVAGLYGMNFHPEVSPLNMPETNWYYGYPFALLLMTLLGGGLALFCWRKGWLTR